MKKSITSVFFIVLLIGCGSEQGAVSKAKEEISYHMIDPSSVQFRNLVSYSGGVVCGEFNAKNRMGAYVGYQEFIYYGKRFPRPEVQGNFSTSFSETDVLVFCRDEVTR
tara:strand:+ start:1126 stop:1452 length:327 start_codon:yes stop_codon:yes gene_type:complete